MQSTNFSYAASRFSYRIASAKFKRKDWRMKSLLEDEKRRKTKNPPI